MADCRLSQGHKAVDVSVVLVPLPAQGHLNQFLHFARLLAALGISVHYMSSASHVRQARERGAALSRHDDDAVDHLIQFHHPPLPTFSAPPADPRASMKFPSHLQPAFDAALHMKSPLEDLVSSLASSSRRVVIVHDGAMPFAAGVGASLPNVEAFCYLTFSAIANFFYSWERLGEPPVQAIADLNLSAVPKFSNSEEFIEFRRRQRQKTTVNSGRILNTCRALEATFIDLLESEPGWQDKKLFAVGPLNPIPTSEPRPHNAGGGGDRSECLAWLDEQPPASVLYVSFGTTMTPTDDQVAELAAGLEASGQRFIWLLRDADRADIYAPSANGGEARKDKLLPSDYYQRIDGRGKVVGGWVPQTEILGHPSVGGFMSHCGWNSCLESFSNGVPMLAWPMHTDQPRNAQLVTDVLRVGFPVRKAGELDYDAVLPAAVIAESIRRLMVEEEGKEAGLRARKLGEEVRRAAVDGGSSKADLDAFIAHITR